MSEQNVSYKVFEEIDKIPTAVEDIASYCYVPSMEDLIDLFPVVEEYFSVYYFVREKMERENELRNCFDWQQERWNNVAVLNVPEAAIFPYIENLIKDSSQTLNKLSIWIAQTIEEKYLFYKYRQGIYLLKGNIVSGNWCLEVKKMKGSSGGAIHV